MCIAIHKPTDKSIDSKIYEDCFFRHSDGAGFCYVDPVTNEIVLLKGFFKDQQLIDAIKPLEHHAMLIHFRTASPKMLINAANCHPFVFRTGITEEDKAGKFQWAMIHNGKLDWRNTEKHSDTACFMHDFLMHHLNRYPDFLDHDEGMWMMERMIGDRNKMAIMRLDRTAKTTTVYIVNEKAGNEEKGIWFSNLTWKYATTNSYDYGYGENYMFPHGAKAAGLVNAATQLDPGIYKDREKFETPDANGWKWSYFRDRWLNDKTHLEAFELSTRARPYTSYKYTGMNKTEYEAWLKQQGRTEFAIVTPNPKLVTIDPEKVEVPRDADVVTAGSPNTPNSSASGLDHLNKDEQKDLDHEAECFLRRSQWGKKELRKMNAEERIHFLRLGCRNLVEGCADMEDPMLDLWMVGQIKAGTFRRELIELERAQLAIEKEAARS
jgi:hypothetical protein